MKSYESDDDADEGDDDTYCIHGYQKWTCDKCKDFKRGECEHGEKMCDACNQTIASFQDTKRRRAVVEAQRSSSTTTNSVSPTKPLQKSLLAPASKDYTQSPEQYDQAWFDGDK